MSIRKQVIVVGLMSAALMLTSCAGLPPLGAVPGSRPADLQAELQERAKLLPPNSGLVVALVDASGSQVAGFGRLSQDNPVAPDADSVFEIGSITKVFTTILLQQMVERGDVKLDDPISKYLPASVTPPAYNGRPITLVDLATQTSGLPRMPDNFAPKDPNNPYADYTVDQLYQFLNHYKLTRAPGAQYEYSNVGMGLLGHILTLRSGQDYETLVTERIAKPLGLEHTRITLTDDMRAHLAPGHDTSGAQVMNWDLPSLAGAGALRSTANDLIKFVQANIGLTSSPLSATLQATHAPRHETGQPGLQIALGWHVFKGNGPTAVWHNGETGGYHTFIGFDPQKRRGVVVLANSNANIDDIGDHLLYDQVPLQTKASSPQKTAVPVAPAILDAYSGVYELAPNFTLTVTHEGDGLFIQATGQPKLPVYAASETEFFYTAVDAQVSFVKDSAGKVTGLVLHQNGKDIPSRKIR